MNGETKLQIFNRVKTNLEESQKYTHSTHLYFYSLIEAPEFHHLQLRVLTVFGESGKYYKTNLQNIVNSKEMFITDLGDHKNLTIITEHFLQKTMSGRYVTYLIVDKIYKSSVAEICMGTVGCFGYLEKEGSEKYPHPIEHEAVDAGFPHRVADRGC